MSLVFSCLFLSTFSITGPAFVLSKNIMGVVTVAVLTMILSQGITFSWGQVDQTVVAESNGENVVNAVVSRIRQSGIFPQDHSFLRRIAYVESKDGNDDNTYRAGYHGGIWQVDDIGFRATQDVSSHPALEGKHRRIREVFGIDWSNVQWMDLRKPLYSGLAARLFLSNINQEIPLASDISGQAQYWKTYYNTKTGAGTVQKFIDDVMALERSQGVCHVIANTRPRCIHFTGCKSLSV